MKKSIITSVLGFNFNADIIDSQGEYVKTGAKTILPESTDKPKIGNRIGGESWFNNWNEALLSKVRDYKRINL